MRVTRAKQYRKHLRFFRIVYGIAAPYKVILDGNFIHGCVSSKVDIQQRLASVLQGAKVHLFVPRAAREELKALGPEFEQAYKFAIAHCRGLPPAPAPSDPEGEGADEAGADPAKEIIAAIGADNAGKYLVASQDEKLRVRLRRVPGCPLVYVSRTVLLMEQPSGKSKAEFEKAERKRSAGTTEEEQRVLDNLKRKEREEREKERSTQPHKRLKKKASAPNPLSCRRAKGAGGGAAGRSGARADPSSENKKPLRKKRKRPVGDASRGGGGDA